MKHDMDSDEITDPAELGNNNKEATMELKIIIGQEVLAKIIGQYLEDMLTEPVKLVSTVLMGDSALATVTLSED
jgi:hypothetical protein